MNIISGKSRHAFIGTDTSTEKLIEIDETGKIVWEHYIGKTVFDVWMLPEDHILYCHYGKGPSGAKIIDKQGNVLSSYETENEVFGCQPLENGNYLVGELRQKCITEVNRHGEIVHKIPVYFDNDNLHEVMRSPRKLHDGNYTVVQPGLCKIIKYNNHGDILWQANTRPDTFGIVEKENGNLVYTCIDGLGEIDETGREIWSLKPEDVPDINIKWLLGIQLLDNGNYVCCNWLGHNHEKEGIPMFEVTPQKEIVWTCACQYITENLANFQLLDTDRIKTCYRPMR